ncbi:MAG: putative phage-associated protein [Bacteriovoracaceae bacterium]|jgi:uncharacterized phage-associated protein
MISTKLENTFRLIIKRHREIYDESPTPMKLQKLCYYAQGYFLAENDGTSIFEEDFEAWVNGPVIPDLYYKFRSYSWKPINEEVPESVELSEAEVETISGIVESYGRYDGAALSTMTHRESPWLDARGDLPESEVCQEKIPKDSLLSFFQKKITAYN